jgi:hypothetical protein
VSASGDAALIGAAQDTVDGHGKVYVFRHSTVWVEEQKLIPADSAPGDQLGWSVSLRGDRALLGAIGDDGERGSAYLFERSGGSWLEKQKLTASDGNALDQFGSYVALSDDVAVVTAFSDQFNGDVIGSAYAYHRNGTNFGSERKLTPSDGRDRDLFGAAVATDGDWAIVGSEPTYHQGAAYLFTVAELPFIATPKSVAPLAPITLECCGGQPGAPVLLAVVEVGVPMFLKIAVGTFDPGGVYALHATVPAGLSGLKATCQAFGIASSGNVQSSNRETVTFE